MTASIHREAALPQPQDVVWQALTDPAVLAEWMYPNDFEPRVGHRFTFRVPPNPKVDFDGTVRCEVLECAPPSTLAYSWAGGAVAGTQVRYRLEPDGDGTRLHFEQSGFDLSQSWGEEARRGAEYGWKMMLDKLADVLASRSAVR
jgi:uncharacterized protein YndB with AHSA1/START domain